jgi:hypothetical protein
VASRTAGAATMDAAEGDIDDKDEEEEDGMDDEVRKPSTLIPINLKRQMLSYQYNSGDAYTLWRLRLSCGFQPTQTLRGSYEPPSSVQCNHCTPNKHSH